MLWYIKIIRYYKKPSQISKFSTAKPKNSFPFNFAIVHIPCVFCVCPISSTATTAALADHKASIVNTTRKVRHSFTSHVIVDKIIQNKNVNYNKTNETWPNKRWWSVDAYTEMDQWFSYTDFEESFILEKTLLTFQKF